MASNRPFKFSILRFDTHVYNAPMTRDQWKLALQGVKQLYVQRQYKHCVARSAELLKNATRPIHPVYEIYLHFYSAISYEILGGVIHQYSKNKLTVLHAALDSFLACRAALPVTIQILNHEEGENLVYRPEIERHLTTPSESCLSEWLSGGSYNSSKNTIQIVDQSIEYRGDDPFALRRSGKEVHSVPLKLHADDKEKTYLIPSPLQIRKSPGLETVNRAAVKGGDMSATKVQNRSTRRPLPLSIEITSAEKTARMMKWTQKNGCDETARPAACRSQDTARWSETAVPLALEQRQSIVRYNSGIQFLRLQIESSIADIEALIDRITKIRQVWQAPKAARGSAILRSFNSADDHQSLGRDSPRICQSLGLEAKEQRIERLRTDGWNTVGLKGRGWKGQEYYTEYCSAVLDELYGG